jgi:cation:H+ antiporter
VEEGGLAPSPQKLIITFALAVIYVPVPDRSLAGRITRPLAALPLLLYGPYLFVQ